MKKIREKREKESLDSDYSSLLGKSINQLLFEYFFFFYDLFFSVPVRNLGAESGRVNSGSSFGCWHKRAVPGGSGFRRKNMFYLQFFFMFSLTFSYQQHYTSAVSASYLILLFFHQLSEPELPLQRRLLALTDPKYRLRVILAPQHARLWLLFKRCCLLF